MTMNPPPSDFIRDIIREDVKQGRNAGRVVTRFPPEPNGYLHIGHAKSICLNFGIAQELSGATCNLRLDDTNPLKENQEYVESIQRDVTWLGYAWQGPVRYTSDYFDALHAFAVRLVQMGAAYVDSQSAEAIRANRGTLTEPGRNSPFRDRGVEENLDLFTRMAAGEFADGSHVLRARIDMAAPNIDLRDPILYRIRQASHHQTGDRWCIYPMYDFSHCLSDALERVTHSLCTLEFEDNRALYDWVLDQFEEYRTPDRPRQIEFARLSLEYTVLSKRKLNELVRDGHVSGWDDPRMPTLSGLRRRGYPPEAIREFCRRIGIAKSDNRVELALLESCVREELDRAVPRAMAVLNPLRVVVEDYPEGLDVEINAPRHPKDETMGTRALHFTRELFIEAEDFMEDPPRDFKRLVPGGEVRLRNAYVIRCVGVEKDPETGAVIALRCTHDPHTLHANPTDRKVAGVIHWVAASRSREAVVRLYDRLFTKPNPDDEKDGVDFKSHMNPDSLRVIPGARVEEAIANAPAGSAFQFERNGYFCVDPDGGFNRTVTLRDTWARMQATQQAPGGGNRKSGG